MKDNCTLLTVKSNEEAEEFVNKTINFYSQEFMKKGLKIEKIIMQRTRAANNGVLKLAVEAYNKTHTDSKLKLIADGIIGEYKING